METAEFEGVVVGAGPTGLFLAAELSLYGCAVLVVERLAQPDPTIKAGGGGVLGAEALARRGLGPLLDAEEATMAAGMAQLAKATGGANPLAKGLKKIGGHFSGLFLIDQSRQREPERRFRAIQQIALERHLAEHAHSRGATVWRDTELIGFTATAQGVDLMLNGSQGE